MLTAVLVIVMNLSEFNIRYNNCNTIVGNPMDGTDIYVIMLNFKSSLLYMKKNQVCFKYICIGGSVEFFFGSVRPGQATK